MSRTDVTAAFILTSSIAILASAQVRTFSRAYESQSLTSCRKLPDPARCYRLERCFSPDMDSSEP